MKMVVALWRFLNLLTPLYIRIFLLDKMDRRNGLVHSNIMGSFRAKTYGLEEELYINFSILETFFLPKFCAALRRIESRMGFTDLRIYSIFHSVFLKIWHMLHFREKKSFSSFGIIACLALELENNFYFVR